MRVSARLSMRCRIPFAIATIASLIPASPSLAQTPSYEIHAVRYATLANFPVSSLVMGAAPDERMDVAMAVWLVRGGGRTILVDAGFHRPQWFERFAIEDYLRPDSAVMQAGVQPGEVTDIVVTHAHWDHMGGIDLFPDATIWIQADEYSYYTGEAWQEGGRHGGIDPEDLVALLRANTAERVRLVAGDDVEIIPGIRVLTGARHTYASQYVLVGGAEPVVIASDNCYLRRNLETRTAGATFLPGDRDANVAALDRMVRLAGAPERVVPGHDPGVFSGAARVARVR